jgi:hypothetical protein
MPEIQRPQAGHVRTPLDDLRAALDWAFAPEGDPALGVALTITAVPLWFQLSLLGECRVRVEHALSTLRAMADRDGGRELELAYFSSVNPQTPMVVGQSFRRSSTVDVSVTTCPGKTLWFASTNSIFTLC